MRCVGRVVAVALTSLMTLAHLQPGSCAIAQVPCTAAATMSMQLQLCTEIVAH